MFLKVNITDSINSVLNLVPPHLFEFLQTLILRAIL